MGGGWGWGVGEGRVFDVVLAIMMVVVVMGVYTMPMYG